MIDSKAFYRIFLIISFISSGVMYSHSLFAADSQSGIATPAQGKGMIASVSDHYKNMPVFYDFKKLPVEHFGKTIGRSFIMGTQSTLIRWELKAGAVLPVHFHVNEQISRVEKGKLAVYSQGQKYELTDGQIMIFPPNVPHEFVALQDTVMFDQLTPARQDFINGEFDKVAAKIFSK